MTAPSLLDPDRAKLDWEKNDKAIADRYNRQTTQDTIVPAASSLTDTTYYDRINTIRNNSASATQGAITVDAQQKAREEQLAAQKMERERQAAMAAAGQAGDAWAMGNPDFGALGYTDAAGGGASDWGTGGAQGVANVLRAAGFNESEIPTFLAIAKAESGWNPAAVNDKNRNGSIDRGLFQINSVHQGNPWYPSNPFDPLQSAKAAYAIYKSQGLSAWSVYNSGAYKQFLQSAPPVQKANIAPYAANTGSATGLRAALVSTAQRYIGLPYIWGGTNLSKGVDCSGLVQSVYSQLGLKLPRTAQEQANWGTNGVNGTRTSVNNLQPGDLVAWNGGYDRGRYIGHIAVYAGNGEIIESPDVGLTVRRRKLRANENAFGVHLNI